MSRVDMQKFIDSIMSRREITKDRKEREIRELTILKQTIDESITQDIDDVEMYLRYLTIRLSSIRTNISEYKDHLIDEKKHTSSDKTLIMAEDVERQLSKCLDVYNEDSRS